MLVDDVAGWALSRDGAKVAGAARSKAYNLYDAKPKAKDKKTRLDRRACASTASRRRSGAEIFDEVWRRYRDFFYVRNMHGYDWKAIGDRYRPLLPYVAHRSDLNYVLGEMVAELNVGHAYIEGGDFEIPARPEGRPAGRALRARRRRRGATGSPRSSRATTRRRSYRSPLTEVGVDAKVGDYVLAIDGVELTAADNPYRLLRYKTDPVTLTLNSKPTSEGARKVTYQPISDESRPALLRTGSTATAPGRRS